MSLKEKVLKVLEVAYQEELAFIDRLPETERATIGAPDQWSAKDILAHVTYWNGEMMDRFEAIRRGKPPKPEDNNEIDHQNLHIFEAHQHDSWDTLRQNIEQVYRRTRQYVQNSTEADLLDQSKMPPANDTIRPWSWIVGSSVTHALLHLADHEIKHGQVDHATRVQEVLAAQLLEIDNDPSWRGATLYNLGCFYALSGQREKAVLKVIEGIHLRPNLLDWSKQDTDLNSIRDDARLQALYVESAT